MKPNIRPDYLLNSKLHITDVNDVQHIYAATATLMISRFGDSIAVVKNECQGHT